jgi:hypothetical protein
MLTMIRSLNCSREKVDLSRLGSTSLAKVLFLTMTAFVATFAQGQSANRELQADGPRLPSCLLTRKDYEGYHASTGATPPGEVAL